ncbi:uncharacterized protein PV09_03344 [Verruconis gallopava]|uniref:Uncharacterized protein n=1 Tax=Verruconis gallopava TaxID=253628 RepID=A0A0D2AG31_9PEZI|nr:uncharacterized protein PV09_03344 [Verruconis gallopava]KIW05455.1 hypothetical protein PV09_03344 [Verruconis gallopava]
MPPLKTQLRVRSYSPTYQHAISPRAFQLRCRRFQSTETSKDEKSALEPMRRVEQPSSPPPQDHNLLLMRIQAAQRAAQKRKFETPSQAGKLKNGKEDASFHPAFAGFVAGLMVAFGLSYTLYHFSGSYHVQKASQKLNKELSEKQKRIAAAADALNPDDDGITVQEVTTWLRRASQYYSTFHPSSDRFVEARDREIVKGLSQGAEKAKEIERIAKDCASELEKEVGPRNAAQNIISGLVTGRTGWYIIMKHLGRIEEAVEGKEYAEKRRQRAAKGILDE